MTERDELVAMLDSEGMTYTVVSSGWGRECYATVTVGSDPYRFMVFRFDQDGRLVWPVAIRTRSRDK